MCSPKPRAKHGTAIYRFFPLSGIEWTIDEDCLRLPGTAEVLPLRSQGMGEGPSPYQLQSQLYIAWDIRPIQLTVSAEGWIGGTGVPFPTVV
jgi:hypothetical protein